MARTTPTAVEKILGRNFIAGTDLAPYIETATEATSNVISCASDLGYTITTAQAELIERWLGAYFYTQMDPLYTSRSTAGASGSYQENSYLNGAKAVDPSGCVEGVITGTPVASMSWLGKPPSSQIDYRDRD